jgi:hypothetical protein
LDAFPAALWGKRAKNEAEKYNFTTYRVPVNSGIKVDRFKQMAGDYWDNELFDLIRFGFPLDVGTEFHPKKLITNRPLIILMTYKNILTKIKPRGYCTKLTLTILTCIIHPHLCRFLKREVCKRVILDLSWPKEQSASVNSCVPSDTYLIQNSF